jgi:general L-amino acid transport system ATP-binding protein
MTNNTRIIEIKRLNYWYEDFQVLKDINLDVKRSSCVVICGPSGSGKSTLLRCINGLEVFKEGIILVNGVSVSQCFGHKKKLYKLRSSIGMVFQHFELYPHMTALGNITLAPINVLKLPKKEARNRAMALLEKVGMEEYAYKYPATLSGGQQQRVAIARAMAMNPDILFFDEPTSALDPEMIRDVLEIMAELAKEGLTMLVVTHEMGFAKAVADSIVFMEEGKIVEHDDGNTFFKNPKSRRAAEFVDRILVHF